MPAAYVFRVRFRPDAPRIRLDPPEFETVLRVPAAPPGEDADVDPRAPADWLFFRDNLWRGEVNDESYLRKRFTDLLGVDVVDCSFSELRTDESYLERLREAIDADLTAFNADDADEVFHKYLGSSIHVVESGDV